MNKVSPAPGAKMAEPKNSALPEKGEATPPHTLLDELSRISSENRKLTSKLNNLITWMDKTF